MDTLREFTTLAERLLLARRRAGLSAGDMALRLRRAPNTVSSWETGRNEISYADLVLWSTICGGHGEALLGEDVRSSDTEAGVA